MSTRVWSSSRMMRKKEVVVLIMGITLNRLKLQLMMVEEGLYEERYKLSNVKKNVFLLLLICSIFIESKILLFKLFTFNLLRIKLI